MNQNRKQYNPIFSVSKYNGSLCTREFEWMGVAMPAAALRPSAEW